MVNGGVVGAYAIRPYKPQKYSSFIIQNSSIQKIMYFRHKKGRANAPPHG